MTLRLRRLEVRIVARLDVRQRHAREIAVRVSAERRSLHERQVVPQHVAIPLPFAEQLTTTLLEHQIGERLPGWCRISDDRDTVRGANTIDRIEPRLSADRLGENE